MLSTAVLISSWSFSSLAFFLAASLMRVWLILLITLFFTYSKSSDSCSIWALRASSHNLRRLWIQITRSMTTLKYIYVSCRTAVALRKFSMQLLCWARLSLLCDTIHAAAVNTNLRLFSVTCGRFARYRLLYKRTLRPAAITLRLSAFYRVLISALLLA